MDRALRNLHFVKCAEFDAMSYYKASQITCEMIPGILSIITIAVPQVTIVTLIAGILFYVARIPIGHWFQKSREMAEKSRRALFRHQYFGEEINRKELADEQGRMDWLAEYLRDMNRETYALSMPQKFSNDAQIALKESLRKAFVTQHLQWEFAKLITFCAALIVVSFVIVLFFFASNPESHNLAAQVIGASFALFLSVNLIDYAISCFLVATSCKKIQQDLEKLSSMKKLKLNDVYNCRVDYECVMATASPVPKWFHKRHKRKLNGTWSIRES